MIDILCIWPVNSRHWNQSLCLLLWRHRHYSIVLPLPLDIEVAIQQARTLTCKDLYSRTTYRNVYLNATGPTAAPSKLHVHWHATTCVIECSVQVCNRKHRRHDLQKRVIWRVTHFVKECIVHDTGPNYHHHYCLLLQRGNVIILASIYRKGSALYLWSVVMSSIDLNQIHKIDEVSNKTLPIHKMMSSNDKRRRGSLEHMIRQLDF
jgi:hypothetical protein